MGGPTSKVDRVVVAGPLAPLSSPEFFGPGSYRSYATSWLFNQAS